MAAQLGTHPSADALRGFAVGKLDDRTAEVIMNHLDGCPDCCRAAAAQSGDDFLDRLRQAHSPSSTPAPAESPTGAESAPQLAASLVANLPAELANNPQYEVLHELGRGGMGVVYLAKNKLMDRLEVLKVVNKALLDRPGAVERFLREIRSAARLNHANVVAAYSAVQSGELLAFAMEYVEGEDLAKLVQTQGPLPVARACDYVQQAALGLQHAFEKQMVHRDIKPQNLILARDGERHIVKVLDFGLAKVTRAKNEDTGLTDEGAMLGTPDYVAPEQTLDAANADIRADVYGLGCTLYYLLTGAPPFNGRSRFEVLQAHQSMESKPLNLVRPEVPEELAAVVRKMMAKDPAQRYQTPMALVQALAPFVNEGAKRGEAPKSKRKWLIGSAIAAAVLLIGLLGLWADGVFRVEGTRLEQQPRVEDDKAAGIPVEEGRRAGEELDDNALKMKFCWCPAGTFRMGSPAGEVDHAHNEGPVDVTLSRGFWMGKIEVTQSQWQRGMGTGLRDQKVKGGIGEIRGEGPDHPMYFVNYEEATEFCKKLTAAERAAGRLPAGWDYRLPTEAQWEYACRAGTTTATAFGDRLGSDNANFDGDRPYNGASQGPNRRSTVPVGSYRPNAWGLLDMHGNVWEWCRDWYADSLAGGRDPQGPPSGRVRLNRGGAWGNVGAGCRSAGRSGLTPASRYDFLGFRVAAVQSDR